MANTEYIILGVNTQGGTLKLALWDGKDKQVVVKNIASPYVFVSKPGILKERLEQLLKKTNAKYSISRYNNNNFVVYVDMKDKNPAEKRYVKDLLGANRCVLLDGIDAIKMHLPMFGTIESKKMNEENKIINLGKRSKKASLEQIVQMPLAAIDVENFFIEKQQLYMASIIVKKQVQNSSENVYNYVGYTITTIPKQNLNGKIYHKISNNVWFDIINVKQSRDISKKVEEILKQHNVVFLAFHNAQHDVDQLNFPDEESRNRKKKQFSSVAEASMYKKTGGFYCSIKALGNHVIDGTGLCQKYFSFLLNYKLKTFASFLFPELKEKIFEEKIHTYEELEKLAKIAHSEDNQAKQAALDIAKRNSFDALITLMIAEQFLPIIVQACKYYNADTSQICMTSPVHLYIERRKEILGVKQNTREVDELRKRKLNNFQLQIIKNKQDCYNSNLGKLNLSSPAEGFVLVPTLIYAYMLENGSIPDEFSMLDRLNFSHSLARYVFIKMYEQTKVFELNEQQLVKQAEQFWDIAKQHNAEECIKFGGNLIYVIQPTPKGLFACATKHKLEELVKELESKKLVYNLGKANIAFTNSKQARFIAYLLERKTIIKEHVDLSRELGSYCLLEFKFRVELIEALVVNPNKERAYEIIKKYLKLLHTIDEQDERLQTLGITLNRDPLNYIAINPIIKMVLGGIIKGEKGRTYRYHKDKKKIEKKIKELAKFLH